MISRVSIIKALKSIIASSLKLGDGCGINTNGVCLISICKAQHMMYICQPIQVDYIVQEY